MLVNTGYSDMLSLVQEKLADALVNLLMKRLENLDMPIQVCKIRPEFVICEFCKTITEKGTK